MALYIKRATRKSKDKPWKPRAYRPGDDARWRGVHPNVKVISIARVHEMQQRKRR